MAPVQALPGPGQGELCVHAGPVSPSSARSLAPAAGSGPGQNCHFRPLIKEPHWPCLPKPFCRHAFTQPEMPVCGEPCTADGMWAAGFAVSRW